MKQCTTCFKIKQYSEFHNSKTNTDGFTNRCKQCDKDMYKTKRNKTLIVNKLISLDGELWKDIDGWKDYMISNFGRVWSTKISNNSKGNFLNHVTSTLYPCVNLKEGNRSKLYKIHRLIAEHFIPNFHNLPEVNHINSNKHDFRLENLEWVSTRENSCHHIKTRKTSSKHIGVHWSNVKQVWIAQIVTPKKRMYLGAFDNEDDAGQAYKNALTTYGLTNKYS